MSSACGGGGRGPNLEAPDEGALRARVVELGLTGNPAAGRDLPSAVEPRAQLGRDLFFAQALGGDSDAACVTCHHPVLGGTDALPLSIGVGAEEPEKLGPGRRHPDGDFTVPRNAPTTFNVGLWDRSLFRDGRVASLGGTRGANGDDGAGIRTPDSPDPRTPDEEAGANLPTAQARFPVTSEAEMRGSEFVAGGTNAELRDALAERLAESDAWLERFEAVYGSPDITFARIADAIGTYERSQVFVDNPWSRYVAGEDDAIEAAAKRGALLFFEPIERGGAGCVGCHRGDFFTNEEFRSIAAPQIGRGKGDGPTETNDYGRARETKRDADRFHFRVPSLLNVAVTGPYTHAGAFSTLHGVVRHHLDPRASLERYDPTEAAPARADDFEANTAEMLSFFESRGSAIATLFAPLALTDDEVDDLVAFLHALTDPCVLDRECLAPWIPRESDPDPDGTRLVAVGEDGNPL